MTRRKASRGWTWLLIPFLALVSGGLSGHSVVPTSAFVGVAVPAEEGAQPAPSADAGSGLPTQLAALAEGSVRVASRSNLEWSLTEILPQHTGSPTGNRPDDVGRGISREDASVIPTSIPHEGRLARSGALSSFATSLPPPFVA